ncbi:MAG TPA: putative sulfate exporter family transporter [Pedococcus sp.]|jgi:uncharacterized integral membrane protein (TIGR00698 family)|nr:putative sulfate exporter family transporter [Pedococcus sp.]
MTESQGRTVADCWLTRRAPGWRRTKAGIPGASAVGIIALLATMVGRVVPVVGGPVIGIVLGLLLSATLGRRDSLQSGMTFVGGRVLQIAVVLLGAQLSLRQVLRVGVGSLPVMIGTLTVCLTLAGILGRRLGISRELRTLIGVGTGICGASAIATISPVIRARDADVAYAISTIFLFNIAAVLTFPAVGHLLALHQHAFGLFAGTAVNDTSSVVAAATSYGAAAGNYAVVVKLTRTLMIIPISLGLAALTRRGDGTVTLPDRSSPITAIGTVLRLVPWFLVGFLLLAAANSAGLIPGTARPELATSSTFLITASLTAIGLSTDAAALRRASHRPLLLGLTLWVAVGVTSLSLQALTGGL